MSAERTIEHREHVTIPMADGCRLAARIWLPEGAEETPVPAVLEYIPYRKRDFTAVRDSQIHGFFARHGYACVRVDLRGSGDSEGVLRDEYLPQELDDGVEVLRWIGAQTWCTGKVGMIGLSWGGFNGLQIAALRPPELAAVISVCSSDDRYADDVHYMGGCMLTDNLSWASNMFAYNACPPDPAVVGDAWRAMWRERLEHSGLWVHEWAKHPTRDDYWRHASVCEDYAAIRCPVYAVSGWADGYSNSVFRLLQHLEVPTKGLIGAWGHKYPHMGRPPIGFLSEALRWWDRWLRGVDNGIEHEPQLRVWMQHSASPLEVERPGRWVAEDAWPSARIDRSTLHLGAGVTTLSEEPDEERRALEVQSPLSVGLFAGKWYSYAAETDLPSDQREEDGGALVFETAPLDEPVEILGSPRLTLRLGASEPVAQVAARLSDVAPEGQATRITYGLLNLTHRGGSAAPEPLEPGRAQTVELALNGVAQRFEAGHRIRLSLSSSYWPLAWPAPRPAKLTVYTGDSRLELPVRPARPEDGRLPDFPPPERPPSLPYTLIVPEHREWSVTHNLATNESALQVVNDDMKFRLDEYDLTVHRTVRERYSYRNYRYDTLRGEVSARRTFSRGDWFVDTRTRTVMTATPDHFRITATLDAYEGDRRVFAKSWDEVVPRKLL